MKISIVFFYCFIIVLLFNSCELFKEKKEYIIYTIPAGEQSSHTKVTLFTREEIKFLARFDHTAIYTTNDPVNQHDLNKLFGFSDCTSSHQHNSARFGWRWFNNQLEVYAYCYANGVRSSKFMTILNLEQDYECSIRIHDRRYIFYLNGVSVTMDRGCDSGGARYYLFPYFGGDEKAPHNITIKIKNL